MSLRGSYLVVALTTVLPAAILFTCTGPENKRSAERKTAEKYCSGCHQFPEPELLNKDTWLSSVLPAMGPRLGVYKYLEEKYHAPGRDAIATPGGIYPNRQQLSNEEWAAILAYYSKNAPDTLQDAAVGAVEDTAAIFFARFPASIQTEPATLGVFIDTSAQRLLVANAEEGTLELYDAGVRLRNEVALRRPVVNIVKTIAGNYLLTDIGRYFPNDFKEGAIWTLDTGSSPKKLIPRLGRPVQVLPADLDTNGRTDYLICAYGLHSGELAWYPSPDRKYVLRKSPGAIQAEITDINHDGRPDVWALFAQGDESLYWFINKGGRGFEERKLLRFPPSYGSSSFEIKDFNGDGYPDILYTCGDNADFSLIAKPYHGVYIYLNNGRGDFEKSWFYPVNGAYKAIARDFDLDGDLDIVSIAYFPEPKRSPGKSLLYFENEGELQFTVQRLPGAAEGRWISMHAGDLDADGDTDIGVASFTGPPDQVTRADPGRWRNKPPFLLLENKTR